MQANNKYIIECVEYSDIEYDENDIAQNVSRYQYWVYDAKTKNRFAGLITTGKQ